MVVASKFSSTTNALSKSSDKFVNDAACVKPAIADHFLLSSPEVDALMTMPFVPDCRTPPMNGEASIVIDLPIVTPPKPAESIALPQGSAFGEVLVDRAKCTMCMSCVGACPESALMDGVDQPLLKFLDTRGLDEPGYERLITHLFREGAQYLDSDVVFGTKQELVVAFDEKGPGPTPDGGELDRPWLSAHYDFVLQPR